MPRSRRRRPRLVTLLSAALVAVSVGTLDAGATTRDAEIRPAPDAPAGLVVSPAVSLARDVRASVAWPLVVTNGGPERVEVELSTHLATPDVDGRPTPGVAANWAVLPRRTLDLAAGEGAQFDVLVEPPDGSLPTAVVLAVSTVGEDVRTAVATLVMWPTDHAPQVALSFATSPTDPGRQQVDVEDLGGPSVVDVRVVGSAWPGRRRQVDVGPLVLLPGATRTVPIDVPRTVLGSRTEAVVAVDGQEVARLGTGEAADPARLAVVALTAGAILVALGLALRHLRRP